MFSTSLHPSPTPPGRHALSGQRSGFKGPRRRRAPAPDHPRFGVVEAGFWAYPLRWVHCAWTRFDRSRSLGLAAEMAFWLFLSLLPLAAVVGLITARLAVGNVATVAPLLQSLPGATRELVGNELGRMAAWNGGEVGVGAGLMFVWLASSGVHSIFDGFELETEMGSPRPWWKKRLLAIATCMALSLGASVLAVLGAGLGRLWQLIDSSAAINALELGSSAAGEIVRLCLGAAVSLGLVSGLYWVGRHPGVPASVPIVPGAILAVLLQVGLGVAYAFYLSQAGDGGAYLAGLASIGVTLMALYLFCLALLAGVQVNHLIGERRQEAALASSITEGRSARPRSARSGGRACADRGRADRPRATCFRRRG